MTNPRNDDHRQEQDSAFDEFWEAADDELTDDELDQAAGGAATHQDWEDLDQNADWWL